MKGIAESVVQFEPWIRAGAFAAFLGLFAAWEALAPRRVRVFPRLARWPTNIGITILNTVLARLLVPAAVVGAAFFAEAHAIGLFHGTTLPDWLEVAIAILVLDLVVYGQHVAFHSIPLLWRMHRIHHADPEIDVTTGLRFHPLEIGLSLLLKAAAVLLIGAPPLAVILFEIALNATSMFSHANIELGPLTDRALRKVIVTPDMHRVHHSVRREERDANFGFNLSLWDRLFRTYRAQPKDGHTNMMIGLYDYPGRTAIGLWWLLANPFAGPVGAKAPDA